MHISAVILQVKIRSCNRNISLIRAWFAASNQCDYSMKIKETSCRNSMLKRKMFTTPSQGSRNVLALFQSNLPLQLCILHAGTRMVLLCAACWLDTRPPWGWTIELLVRLQIINLHNDMVIHAKASPEYTLQEPKAWTASWYWKLWIKWKDNKLRNSISFYLQNYLRINNPSMNFCSHKKKSLRIDKAQPKTKLLL